MVHVDEEPEEPSDSDMLLDLIQQHLAELSASLKSVKASLSKPTLTFADGLFFGCGFAIAAAAVAIPAAFVWAVLDAALTGSN